ncbi:MAG: rhodanese-like domain-containing protein [Bacteroidales bacterium]|jgi:rhodanese-related sulfurtransferase|nr:rhodanese-like domain-containing protein [Bacteroidales bacterium]
MKKITLLLSALFISFLSFAQVKVVNADEFEKQMKATKCEQLIDVRTPQEFEKNHLENAVNIDFKSPDFKKSIEKLDKTKPVLVYCVVGKRSNEAGKIFIEEGFKTVYDLEGGLNAWIKAEKAVEQ